MVNRWYQILQHFITRGQSTLEELKTVTGTSAQTIKKSIDLLNGYLEQVACIEETAGLYQLSVLDSVRFEKVMSGSLKQQMDFNSSSKRIAVLIDRFLKSNTYTTIDALSELIGVSRSTVNKDLRTLKNVLQTFDLSLIGTPNKGLILKGDEENCRLLYVYHGYDYLENTPLSKTVLQQIDQIAEEKKLDVQTMELFKKVITLTVQRIRKGHPLAHSLAYYVNYFAQDPQLETLMLLLEEGYGVTISQLDADFICFPLNIFNNNSINEQAAANAPVQRLFQQMMARIKAAMMVNIDDAELFETMKAHFMFLVNRVIFRVAATDIFEDVFRNKHPFAYELADIGITALADILHKPKQSSEVSFLAIYFALFLKTDGKNEPKAIAVVCNTGKGTALMIKRQLENVLGPNIQISHFSEEEYQTKNLDRYFAVFTTIPLTHTKATTSVIKLTDLFNENRLLGEWKRIIASKAVMFPQVLFRFESLLERATYKENLVLLLTKLQQEKLVDEAFGAYILTKAQEESAVIDNGVAFPHGINEQSDQIIVSIGTYQKITKVEPIELIFLVAIPANLTLEAENELMCFYDTIFTISSSATLRQKLKQVSTKEAYRKLVTKEDI